MCVCVLGKQNKREWVSWFFGSGKFMLGKLEEPPRRGSGEKSTWNPPVRCETTLLTAFYSVPHSNQKSLFCYVSVGKWWISEVCVCHPVYAL